MAGNGCMKKWVAIIFYELSLGEKMKQELVIDLS
jgi:hypothetical protein